MFRKPFIALAVFAAFAAAGSAAHAEDITMADESFMSTKTRAEVCDEAVAAIAAGTAGVSEVDLSSTMARKAVSTVSRDQVRAELGKAWRQDFTQWYPA